MRRDGETGEFELVLGNGQLLSGLFIVVLLFAVFLPSGTWWARIRRARPSCQTRARRRRAIARSR